MKKKIMVVEDDELFRSTLAGILEEFYIVSEAENGRIARQVCGLEEFDLILSDVQMPYLSGIELLEWIKNNRKMKFILMTGFSHILETKKAHDLGADDFLAKPFSKENLLEKVAKLLKDPEVDAPAEPEKDLDHLYCKIPIDDFITDRECNFGVYLRINSTKYIKIAHQGGKINPDKVVSMKSKGLEFVYVHHDDFPKLVGFSVSLSKVISENTSITDEKKKRFLKYTGELVVQNAFVNGLNEMSVLQAKSFVDISLQTANADDKVYQLINVFSQHSDYVFAHSLCVSIFSVLIAKAMGLQSASTLFKVSLGGLLHDIGKKEINSEILNKPRILLSQHEREILETHPLRGFEIISAIKNIPSEVSLIAYEHHENNLGQGFPRRLTKKQIHPLTNIVATANVFAGLTLKSVNNENPLSATEAIAKIEKDKSDILDIPTVVALKSVIYK